MVKRTLWEGAGIGIELSKFGPSEKHPVHADRHSRITFVLSGQFWEVTDIGGVSVAEGDVLFKSRNVRHEDQFDDSGVRLASVVFRTDERCPLERCGLERLWTVKRSAEYLRSYVSILEASFANDGQAIEAAVADLLSFERDPRRSCARPPSWLKRLKLDLEAASLATINVARRARDAGVHPVHASRLFRQLFSVSITEHALYHCVRGAIAMFGRKPMDLSEIAVSAGFYDQSHMTRVFGRVTGKTPGRYRNLTAQAIARCEGDIG